MAKPKKRQEQNVAPIPWGLLVLDAFPKSRVDVPLSQIYARVGEYLSTKTSPHWKAAVHRVLQQWPFFVRVKKGVWRLDPGTPIDDAPKSKR